MSNNYPLYPELSEQGKEEAQKVIDRVKQEIAKAANDAIGDLYTDLSLYIESDHRTNYRNKIVAGFHEYDSGQADRRINFRELREAVYREHRDEIIEDLNQDLREENDRLKKRVEYLGKIVYAIP